MEDEDTRFTPLAQHIMTHLAEDEDCTVTFITETAIDVTGPFDIEDLATSVRQFYPKHETGLTGPMVTITAKRHEELLDTEWRYKDLQK